MSQRDPSDRVPNSETEAFEYDRVPLRTRKRRRGLPRIQLFIFVSAVLFFCSAIGVYYYSKQGRPPEKVVAAEATPSEAESPGGVLSGEAVYKRLLKSTAFVLISDGANLNRPVGVGSGVVVHAPRKLLLTNYHVVKESSTATIFFPRYEPTGEVIARPNDYTDNAEKHGIKAKVVFRDSTKDLALLELASLPANIVAIPLATRPAAIGSKLYSIGASGVEVPNFSGTLWRLSTGETRGRNEQKLTAGGRTTDAMILESQKPVNPGDSGGPTVNEAGALTGLVCMIDRSRAAVSLDIDLIEIEKFLVRYAKEEGWAWNGAKLDLAPGTGGSAGSTTVTSAPTETETIPKMIAQLSDSKAEVRLGALRKLQVHGPTAREAIPKILKATDDADARVQWAAEEALEKIGPPGKVEMLAYEEGLAGAGGNVQRLSVAFYLRPNAPGIPGKAIPGLIRLLESPSSRLQLAGIQLLTAYGPDCKRAALSEFLKLADSEVEAVRQAAQNTIEKWAPYAVGDIPQWLPALESNSDRLQLVAVKTLSLLALNSKQSSLWFRPCLTDSDPGVVIAALQGIAKWGEDSSAAGTAIEVLTQSKSEEVAVEAIQTLCKILSATELPLTLGRLKFDNPKSQAIVAARLQATLAIRTTDDRGTIDAMKPLLKGTPKAIRVEALRKLIELGAKAEPALVDIANCLNENDLSIQRTALEALTAIGEPAASQAPAVVRLLKDKPEEEIGNLAVQTLAAFGPKAVDSLAKAYRNSTNGKQADRMLAQLENYGANSTKASPMLLEAAEDSQHPHGALHAATLSVLEKGKGTSTDPISKTLAVLGGDGLAAVLIKFTAHEVKNVLGQDTYYLIGKLGGRPTWALQMFQAMDPKSVTDVQRADVLKRLRSLDGYDLSKFCRTEAKAALAKWEPKK